MPIVYLGPALRPFAGGASSVQAEGATVRQVLYDLIQRQPAFEGHLLEDSELRQDIFVAINGEETFGLDTPVPEGAEVHILSAIAGG
jgi:molybdopterin synthase sulfur carrier subunit